MMKTVALKKKEMEELLKTLNSDQKALLKKGLTVLENADPKTLANVFSSDKIVAMCECSGTTGEPGIQSEW